MIICKILSVKVHSKSSEVELPFAGNSSNLEKNSRQRNLYENELLFAGNSSVLEGGICFFVPSNFFHTNQTPRRWNFLDNF